MTQKSLGYMELAWTCPNCSTENPGLQKTCKNCGAPQPENVQFHTPQQQDILSDEKKVTQAAKGADFHCPYCGTRNPADAATCSQCGGDLTGAVQRVSGKVVGATQTPAQGNSAPQPAKAAPFFRWWMLLPLGAILMICCVIGGYLVFYRESVTGTVQNVSWQRIVPIQALRDVTRSDWQNELPQDANILSCDLKYRGNQSSPAAHATEVCSTALVDQGNGAAEVVETCSYEVYDDYCEYTAQEWVEVDQAVAQGSDMNPDWPNVNLAAGEREGERKETYKIVFETSKGIKEYTTDNESMFLQLQPGSTWTLEINPLGMIVNVQP